MNAEATVLGLIYNFPFSGRGGEEGEGKGESGGRGGDSRALHANEPKFQTEIGPNSETAGRNLAYMCEGVRRFGVFLLVVLMLL